MPSAPAAPAPGGQSQSPRPSQPQQVSYFDVLQNSFNMMLQHIAITVKSERRLEERRSILQTMMAANINRWQENLDRLEDELNHARAILRRDYALFMAERDRQLQDAAAAREKASTPAVQPKQEPAPLDDLIMLDAAPAAFAKAERAAPSTEASSSKADGDAKPSTPAAQQQQQQASNTPVASQTNTPNAPAGGAIVIDDDDPAKSQQQAPSAADAGLDIAAMLQVLTGSSNNGGAGSSADAAAAAAAAASPGVMNLDALPGSGGSGPGGFGEPVLLPGLESYASMSEAQSAADGANKTVSSSVAEPPGSLPGGDPDILVDDSLDELFGSDSGDVTADFSNWLNELGS